MKRSSMWWTVTASAGLAVIGSGCGGSKPVVKEEVAAEAPQEAAAETPSNDAPAPVAAAPVAPAVPVAPPKSDADELLAMGAGNTPAAAAPGLPVPAAGGAAPAPDAAAGRPSSAAAAGRGSMMQGGAGGGQGGPGGMGPGYPQPGAAGGGSASFAGAAGGPSPGGPGGMGPGYPQPGAAGGGSAAFAGGKGGQAGGPSPGGPAAGGPSPGGPGGMGPGYPQPGAAGGSAGFAGAQGPGGRGQAGGGEPGMAQPGGGGEPGATAPAGGRGAGRMGPGGGPGGPGGDGGGNLADGDFTTETKGAESFLSALRSKDPEKLAEATAKHAEFEAINDHKPVFKDILAKSASAEDLDKLAREFAGMKVTMASRKSSGTASVIVSKEEENALIKRALVVRKEKDGWKVQDYGGKIIAKMPGQYDGTGRRPKSKK